MADRKEFRGQVDFKAATNLEGTTTISGNGAFGVALSGNTTVAAAAGDTDATVSLPAYAVIQDVGVVCGGILDGTTNTPNVTLAVGTSAGGQQYVATTTIVSAGTMSAGTVASINQAAESTTKLSLVNNSAAMFNSSARDVHFRLTTSADLDGAGAVGFFVTYFVAKP